MQIKEVDVEKVELFSIGQQYSHNALAIHFVNLPNLKNKYIYYKIDDIEEEIPLVSDLFIVSRPLTLHSGEVKAQIIVRDEANETIGLTKNFTMIITPSNYSGIGEDESYPDDPNIKNYFVKIDEKVNSFEELANLVQTKLDNGEFVGAQGPKGEKGEPGDVTEEYKNLANQIAQNASDAQASATNAQTSASNAQKILDDTKEFANQAKTEVNQIKTDTSALKDEANASAVNAKASETKAKEYADNLKESTDDISQLKEDLVANEKEDAKTKRSLSALWDLNNGISYRFETDSEKAYQKKVLSGAKLSSVNKVGGKTIVMNQIFKIASVSANGLTFSVDNDGLITINGTASSYFATLSQINDLQNKEGKFFIKMTIVENPNTVAFKFGYTNRNKFTDAISSGSTSTIFTQTNAELAKAKYQGIAGFQEGTVFDNVKVKIMIFDLTKMFGSGNEPTTPEEFEAMFPNDYYPYNEGELMSMGVNDVIEKGRNLFDCYGFSSKVILHINDKRQFTNDYGTSISTIEPVNKVIATQTQAPDSYTTSSNNGFFYIGIKNMESAKKYILSFDFTPTKMLLESGLLLILVNGRFPSSPVSVGELNAKKRIAFPFEYKVVDDRQFLEIRLAGMSGIFENFQLDEGNVETAYTPYHAPISHPIPQSILSLDGYGWSAGQAYNYVDFENKKYYKCVDRIDLGVLLWKDIGISYGSVYRYDASLFKVGKAQENNVICSRFEKNIISTKDTECYNFHNKFRYLIIQSKIDNLDTFKSAMQGVYLYYELTEPIVTDISDIIGDTFQEPFEVESGGSLTFKNSNGDGYQVAVPSDIQYTVALSEVNA